MHTIMLVDDSKFVRMNLCKMLQDSNFQTIEASNGKEAIDLITNLNTLPELIICDIIMPEMDGYEFYSYISTKPELNHIPFVFLSAKSSPEDVRIGKMLGADDYLVKPVDPRDLIATVKGKISRNQYRSIIQNQFKHSKEYFIEKNKLEEPINIKIGIEYKNQDSPKPFLWFIIRWDDVWGPVVCRQMNQGFKSFIDANKLGEQLFSVVNAVYGHDNFKNASESLIHLSNLGADAFILIDFKPNQKFRGGQELYLICIVASRIDYFTAEKLKFIFLRISDLEKRNQQWNFEDFEKEVQNVFKNHF